VLTDCACYILSCVPLQVLLLNCIAMDALTCTSYIMLSMNVRMCVMPTPGGIPLGIPAGMTSSDVIFWQGGVVA